MIEIVRPAGGAVAAGAGGVFNLMLSTGVADLPVQQKEEKKESAIPATNKIEETKQEQKKQDRITLFISKGDDKQSGSISQDKKDHITLVISTSDEKTQDKQAVAAVAATTQYYTAAPVVTSAAPVSQTTVTAAPVSWRRW